jgi:ribosomal protein S18 acetylase RimI-like enzyme
MHARFARVNKLLHYASCQIDVHGNAKPFEEGATIHEALQERKSLKIRKARMHEADAINQMYEAAKAAGKERGNTDWDVYYPNMEIVIDDIEHGNLYVYEVNGRLLASITMIPEDTTDISPLEWGTPDGCFLTRLCVSPEQQNMGLGEFMMREITEYSKSIGIKATHHLASISNPAANRLYEKMEYSNRGMVFYYEHHYYAYEMIIRST